MKKRERKTGPLDLTIAANVRRLRKAAGLKQADLAHLLDCSQAYVSQIEKCIRGVGPLVLAKLARALKVSTVDLRASLPDQPEATAEK